MDRDAGTCLDAGGLSWSLPEDRASLHLLSGCTPQGQTERKCPSQAACYWESSRGLDPLSSQVEATRAVSLQGRPQPPLPLSSSQTRINDSSL